MDLNLFIEELSENWNKTLRTEVRKAKHEFETNEFEINFSDLNLNRIPNTFGVYLFKIRPGNNFDIDIFKKNWKPKKSGIKRPSIIKDSFINFNVNSKNNLYLGKSEKLFTRIKEHCTHDAKKSTYGLKIKEAKELLKCKITITYYPLNGIENYKKNKGILQFIITNLEKKLREELKPLIGKQ